MIYQSKIQGYIARLLSDCVVVDISCKRYLIQLDKTDAYFEIVILFCKRPVESQE